jgi:hypothetical protein
MKIAHNLKRLSSSFAWTSFGAVLILLGSAGGAHAQDTGGLPSTTTVGLKNPISIDTLAGFVKSILDIVVMIGIPIIALAIIYSGFLFVKAKGDPKELSTAKETFLYTIIGAAIILGSWILAQAICSTVAQLGASATCQ